MVCVGQESLLVHYVVLECGIRSCTYLITKRPAWPNHDFFLSWKEKFLKSPFPVLLNFVWGTLHLRLLQRCVVRLYVTHNQVYVTAFTVTLHRMTCERTAGLSSNKTSKRKVFLGNLQLEHSLVYFHNPFQLLFELEKKSSLVTCALSAKSYTRDTDRPSLARGVSLMQDLAEKARVTKF